MKQTTIQLILAILLQASGTFALAGTWQVNTEASMIGFEAFYDNQPFTGKFHQYSTVIQFDPDNLVDSELKCDIQLASVDTQSRDRDSALLGTEWFNSNQFPIATFQSQQIEIITTNRYTVTGVLKLKGVERMITIPFEWHPSDEQKDRASMRATVTLDRRDFNIGSGEWAEDDTIGFKVQVLLDLQLHHAPQ